ncbi:MAG: hypothetical protein ACJ8DC_05535 [Gemmatimonadales bacterium]
MDRARILVAISRPILASIVRSALGVDPDWELFEADERESLPELARRLEPDVVILEQNGGDLTASCCELLWAAPGLKVLLLANDGREAFVWELRPERVPLGGISTSALREAVRRLIRESVA